MMIRTLLLLLATLFAAVPAWAQSGAFDLPGPQLEATVTRGGETLPLGRVPQLQVGDRIRIEAALPADRSGRHMLVVAFLRDAATPPPKDWFTRLTLTRKADTLVATVPEGAKEAVVLLAPEVGGGYGALVSAVRGRPGVFIRAARDLGQASLDRARLEAFLEGIHAADVTGGQTLETLSPVLARSLAIRWTPECLQRERSLQAPCLTQSREALILNDGRKATLAETLTGAPVDLAYQVSATPEGGAGYYNPYITLVREVARLLGAFRSPQYQYIPALALGRSEEIKLLLNTAPSFQKPHSVLVAPLPSIELPELPTIRAAAPAAIACVNRPGLALPIEGAPLLYAAGFAHDLTLRARTSEGTIVEVPVRADAARGGLMLAGTPFPATLGPVTEATLQGRWGFDPIQGPAFKVQGAAAGEWRIATGGAPVVGRANEIVLDGGTAACVESVSFAQGDAPPQPAEWKPTGAGSIAVTLPLQNTKPGGVDLRVKRFGIEPERLALTAYTEGSRIDSFVIHAGDRIGTLSGTRLDQVAGLDLDGTAFQPRTLSRVKDLDQLALSTEASLEKLRPGQQTRAKVTLKDGRSVNVRVQVAEPRPSAAIVNRTVEMPASPGPMQIQLLGDRALPGTGLLTFALQAQGATRFDGRETIEIEGPGGAVAILKPGTGLTRVDAATLVARLRPAESLGAAAFGPLRFRVVQGGAAGDWTPLASLVRMPDLRSLTCPEGETACTLGGSDLYLIEAVSADPSFATAAVVPPGYTATSVTVPRASDGTLHLKLRDAPDVTVKVAKTS